MPTVCEGCRHYSPADAAGPCPECGQPMKFTLLPPPGADPEPMELAGAEVDRPLKRWEQDAAGPQRPWVYDVATDVRFLAVVGVAGFVVLLGVLWRLIDPTAGVPVPAPK